MTPHKIAIKLFTQSDTFAPSEFVPIFHSWIQSQSLEDHLLIDVADYAHVPDGPGSLLVTSQANIHMDCGENRLGLLYVRKQPIENAETFRAQLQGTLAEALKIAAKLEQEPTLNGRLKFRTDEISIRLNDRLLTPNTPETFTTLKPDIQAVANELFRGKSVTIENYKPSPLTLLDVRIKTTESTSVPNLLEHLIGTTA